jgi:hypothetical protein
MIGDGHIVSMASPHPAYAAGVHRRIAAGWNVARTSCPGHDECRPPHGCG